MPAQMSEIFQIMDSLNASLARPEEINTTERLMHQPENAALLPRLKNLLSAIDQTVTRREAAVNHPSLTIPGSGGAGTGVGDTAGGAGVGSGRGAGGWENRLLRVPSP